MPAMIGGIVGGLIAFIIIVGIIVMLLLRRRRRRKFGTFVFPICHFKIGSDKQSIWVSGRHDDEISRSGSVSPADSKFPYEPSADPPLTATNLLGPVREEESTTPAEQTAALHPLRYRPFSTSVPPQTIYAKVNAGREMEPERQPEASWISLGPSPTNESGVDDSPFPVLLHDETALVDTRGPHPEETNSNTGSTAPRMRRMTRVSGTTASTLDQELITRLEFMAQRIPRLEEEERSPPQYAQ
ncbi:hypothetical protein PQX77_015570 [Marasmius sp. AFHP31]|nr:hypothetical protein PQX77_015570 [Marasmius sp. AFHP31]